MKNPFTHLHLHTDYSSHDGVCDIYNLVQRAKVLGYDALAISDHGTMSGAIKFYEECKKNDIKPTIGVEAYICNDMKLKSVENNKTHHILLLAYNNIGYKNLIKLSTYANMDGFYKKPRIDFNLLAQHKEGLVVSSGCMLGELATAILNANDNLKTAMSIASRYKDVFGDKYFLEIMYQGYAGFEKTLTKENKSVTEKQGIIIKAIVNEISPKLGIKYVITNDTHYICRDDYLCRNIKMSIRQINKNNADAAEVVKDIHSTLNYYLTAPEEMYMTFSSLQGGLLNAYEIGQMSELSIPSLALNDKVDIRLPNYSVPKDDQEFNDYCKNLPEDMLDEVKYVKFLTRKELINKKLLNEIYINRLKRELGVVECNPVFCKDFLIVRDYISYAINNNIYTGVGRGSAAGSLILYLLGITQIDPIKYDLDFDRFLSADEEFHTSLEDYN